MEKDFTPMQAKSWVARELSKHSKREAILKRIRVEKETLEYMPELAETMPNSYQAHKTLITKLEEKLKKTL